MNYWISEKLLRRKLIALKWRGLAWCSLWIHSTFCWVVFCRLKCGIYSNYSEDLTHETLSQWKHGFVSRFENQESFSLQITNRMLLHFGSSVKMRTESTNIGTLIENAIDLTFTHIIFTLALRLSMIEVSLIFAILEFLMPELRKK